MPPPDRPRQRGASLLEALIGVLVVSVGLLATAQWHQRLREASALARQQAEATRHAQRELEDLRAYGSRGTQAGLTSYDAIASASSALPPAAGRTTAYTIDRQVTAWPQPDLKALAVAVHWQDLRNAPRSLLIDSLIAPQSPSLALALGQAPPAGQVSPLFGRHAAIPREAHDLDPTRAVFKPLAEGHEAWLFDRRSGRLLQRCTNLPGTLRPHQITQAHLTDCDGTPALLLAGRVRFDPVAPPALPDPTRADGPVLTLEVEVVSAMAAAAGPASCRGEAVRLVQPRDGQPPRAVALAATPASEALGPWDELGHRHWRYHCTVGLVPATAEAPAHWAGRLRLIPRGWTIGQQAGSQRVCRYSADTDGSGAVDRPAEHPTGHAGVEEALVEQNFLVVDGLQDCPASPAAAVAAGSVPWSSGNPATVPHQP
jgi:type II secretory pathway pseudopilin PulG